MKYLFVTVVPYSIGRGSEEYLACGFEGNL